MAAEEIKRDLQLITTFLNDLVKSTQSSSFEIENLRKALDSLTSGRFVGGGPNTIVQGLKEIISNAGLAAEEVLRLNAVIDEAFASQQVFSQFRGVRGGWNIVQGIGPAATGIDEQLFEEDPKVSTRLQALGTEVSSTFPPSQIESVRKISKEFENFGRTLNITSAHEEALAEHVKRAGKELEAEGRAARMTTQEVERLNELARRLSRPFSDLSKDPFFTASLPGGRVAVKNVTAELDKMNFSLNDVKDIQEDSSRGIVRYSASVVDQNNVTRRATIVTDKWGNILQSTQKNFRTFASAIQRNILEVIKWAIAVGLVYGSIRKLQEILEKSIQIQSKLADVQVTLGASAGNLNVIFENAATIAREMGTELVGVVDGYVLALRAAGKYSDETERVQKATVLLRDSMILAKLSGLEQSLALDTLVGALSQTGRELDEGISLLDKWVAVSKEANVSLATLAESFAITSTAAENVGIDLDKLNGIIAAVAEVTTLSATESGNAVRAFISGFQTQEAEKALARYGIAIRDARGELLSFIDVVETIVQRQELGIITDRDVARISEAIGGGARRGAQVNAFIENYSRVLELSAVSANASGDAQEALALKLDTVETAITNLSNAFTELAHALGERGGFLDAMAETIEFLTGIVDGIKSLIEILGPATKAVAAFAGAWLLLGGIGPLRGLQDRMGIGGGSVAAGFQGASILTGMQRRLPQQLQGAPQALGGALSNQAFGRAAGGAGIGLVTALASGTTELDKAGVVIAGGIAGTLIAGPVGGIIGSLIGQMFVDTVETEAGVIAQAFRSAITGEFEVVIPEGEGVPSEQRLATAEQELARLLDRAITQAFGPGFAVGPAISRAQEPIQEYLRERGDIGRGEVLTQAELERQFRRLFGEYLSGLISPEIAADLFGEAALSSFDFANFFTDRGLRESISELVMLIPKIIAEEIKEAEQDLENRLRGTEIGARLAETQQAIAPTVRGAGEAYLNQLREQIISGGGASVSQVRKLREELPQLQNEVAVVYEALANTSEVVGGIDSIVQSADELALLLLEGGTEFRAEVSAMANELLTLYAQLEDPSVREFGNQWREIINRVSELKTILPETVRLTQEGLIIRDVEVPTIIDVLPEFENQMNEIVALAFEMSNNLIEALGLDETQKQAILDTYEDVVIRSGDVFRLLGREVPVDFLQEIIKERGLGAREEQRMQVLTPDVPSSALAEIRARISFFENLLKTIPGFELEPETLGVVFSDFVTDILHGDNLAIQLALRDLIKVNEEQLEGIFNIPEGMTAFIPFTAAMNLPGAREGTGGFDLEALAEAFAPPEERTVETISDEISSIKEAIMEGSISTGAGLAKIEELWREIQSLGGLKLIAGTERDEGSPLTQLLPDVINVYVTNDIEIDIPVYIRGDIIQREVRRYLERDFSQTVSRIGTGSPNLTYQ